MFNVFNQNQQDLSKKLSIASRSEVPIKEYFPISCFSSTKGNSWSFIIPSSVADIKYKIPGTPFSEKFIQKINILDININCKQFCNDEPTIAFFLHW